MTELVIDVPMAPPREMFPNVRHRRGGLYPGIAAAEESREVAKYAAMEAAQRYGPIAGPVHLTIHAAYGYKRACPDLDATVSAVKAMVDGIVDAGVLYDDDQVKKLTATHEKLRAGRREKPLGWTRFIITEMGE